MFIRCDDWHGFKYVNKLNTHRRIINIVVILNNFHNFKVDEWLSILQLINI